MAAAEYSSDADGARPVAFRYRYSGRIAIPEFLSFAAERARWLDVRGWAQPAGDDAGVVVAAGPEAMVAR